MIEKLIFNIIAISLFTITFLKLVKKNESSYIYLLLVEFIGIAINFIELFITTSLGWGFKILMYLLAIVLPTFLFWLEKIKKIDLAEMFQIIAVTILRRIGKEDKAKTILVNFLNKNQNSYRAHKLLAEIYEKAENYEAAISEYIRVTELNRNDFVSNYQLAFVLNKNKQNEEAIIVLQDILKQKPEYEQGTNLLGEILFEQERYKEAVSVYMTALRYHPRKL